MRQSCSSKRIVPKARLNCGAKARQSPPAAMLGAVAGAVRPVLGEERHNLVKVVDVERLHKTVDGLPDVCRCRAGLLIAFLRPWVRRSAIPGGLLMVTIRASGLQAVGYQPSRMQCAHSTPYWVFLAETLAKLPVTGIAPRAEVRSGTDLLLGEEPTLERAQGVPGQEDTDVNAKHRIRLDCWNTPGALPSLLLLVLLLAVPLAAQAQDIAPGVRRPERHSRFPAKHGNAHAGRHRGHPVWASAQ